jgi:hypothetical protein
MKQSRLAAGTRGARGDSVTPCADGSRRKETLTYKAAPGQSTVEAAAAALRALPGVGEALEHSLW